MSIEQKRFEKFASVLNYDTTKHETGFYLSKATAKAWLVWQAALGG